MIEITNIKGGRKRYNEDIRCLQESALAFTEIFKNTEVYFVISGCQNHQDGYVWLDGKIRYVPSSDSDLDYIVCNDTDGAEIPYHDASEHLMCHNYDAMYSNTPTTPCIKKTNGEFPRLKDTLLGYYGILKDSADLQLLNSPVYFNSVKLPSVIIDGNTTLKATETGLEICTKNGNFRLRADSPVFEKYNGDTIEWQINGDNGNIFMPRLSGDYLSCTDIETKAIKIGGKSIEDVLAISDFPKLIKDEHLVYDKEEAVSVYPYITVRQDKERVVLRGTIENQYILGEENHFVVDFNTLHNSKYGDIVSYSGTGTEKLVLFKSILRLPDSIDAPNASRLPGVMLMSDGSQEGTKQYVSGNAQLIIGADKHLYFLMKTEQVLTWRYTKVNCLFTGPYINFSFYVD